MQMTPVIVFGLAFLAYALTWVPDQYKPVWSRRLDAWQTLIGLVAVVAAILIVMNPEFYALGLLGDSAFFDLLVLAISFQLQMVGSQAWRHVVAAFSAIKRFITLRLYANYHALALIGFVTIWTFADMVCTVQKAVQRMFF
jgi:uncharacterized membrane protein YkgB